MTEEPRSVCKICEELIDNDEIFDIDEDNNNGLQICICCNCNYKVDHEVEIKQFNELLKNHSYQQEEELQHISHDLHTETNCRCNNPSNDTFTLTSEGAGDIEMCLDCYGALGCVY